MWRCFGFLFSLDTHCAESIRLETNSSFFFLSNIEKKIVDVFRFFFFFFLYFQLGEIRKKVFHVEFHVTIFGVSHKKPLFFRHFFKRNKVWIKLYFGIRRRDKVLELCTFRLFCSAISMCSHNGLSVKCTVFSTGEMQICCGFFRFNAIHLTAHSPFLFHRRDSVVVEMLMRAY